MGLGVILASQFRSAECPHVRTASQLCVTGTVDLAHPPAAGELGDLVRAERSTVASAP